MSTNKQRRESERLRLQRELQERRQREASRRRLTMISSIVGALVVIAAIVVVVVLNTGGSDKPKVDAGSKPSATPSATPSASPTASSCGQTTFPKTTVKAATGKSVSFDGVTIKGAADLKGEPGVTSKSATTPTKLAYKDLVVGKGAAAGPTSCVTVQYSGVLYKNGTAFDSSWSRGMLAQFPLTGVVPGFTQGIGGTTGVPPMRIGGRRVVVLPSALGYGAQGSPPKIPANAPLVFVIDLTAVSAG